MKASSTISIKASAEEVFKALTEQQSLDAVVPRSDLPARAQLLQKVPNSKLVAREQLGRLIGTTTTTVEPSPEGSTVSIDFDFFIKGLLGRSRRWCLALTCNVSTTTGYMSYSFV